MVNVAFDTTARSFEKSRASSVLHSHDAVGQAAGLRTANLYFLGLPLCDRFSWFSTDSELLCAAVNARTHLVATRERRQHVQSVRRG